MVGCAYDDTAQLTLPKFCINNDTIVSQLLLMMVVVVMNGVCQASDCHTDFPWIAEPTARMVHDTVLCTNHTAPSYFEVS